MNEINDKLSSQVQRDTQILQRADHTRTYRFKQDQIVRVDKEGNIYQYELSEEDPDNHYKVNFDEDYRIYFSLEKVGLQYG